MGSVINTLVASKVAGNRLERYFSQHSGSLWMECFAKVATTAKIRQPFFTKRSTLNIWQGSECTIDSLIFFQKFNVSIRKLFIDVTEGW